MRPREANTRAELGQLIELQAASFQSLPWFWDGLPPVFSAGKVDKAAKQRLLEPYLASSRALQARLDFCELADAFPACWHVDVLLFGIFPPEWRRRTCRTYLPDELPGQLAVWKTYLSAVQQGEPRAYLLALFLYETSMALYVRWDDLVQVARRSHQHTDAWATSAPFLAVRDAIEQLAPPTLHPAPLWATWQEPAPDHSAADQARYAQHRQQAEGIRRLSERWNNLVPSSWKLMRWFDYTFEDFLARAHDETVAVFFAWADRCCAEQMGVYLDS
jgi:hypothetical protein